MSSIYLEVKPHPFKKGILTIFIDHDSWKEISITLFGKRPDLPKKETLEEFEKAFQKLEFKQAYIYTLRRLATMNYYSHNLYQKLLEKEVDPPTAEKVITKCIEEGYLNDDEWLKNYINRQIQKNRGPAAITAKLLAKGIKTSCFQNLLEELFSENRQLEILQNLIETKYTTIDLSDYPSRQKLLAVLSRKGFPIAIINEAISSI